MFFFLRPNACHIAAFNSSELCWKYSEAARKEKEDEEEIEYDSDGL